MSYNYVVTAYKGTAVTAVQTGNFTGPEDINLIQAKGSSLAVSVVTPEGLKPVADASIYGRISLMQVFRPKVNGRRGGLICGRCTPIVYLSHKVLVETLIGWSIEFQYSFALHNCARTHAEE